jgi:hypothetical protein
MRNPVDAKVPAFTPLIAKPNWFVAARYRPVVALPVKESEGAAAEPLPNVSALINDEVDVCALKTLVPSQIAMMVWF